MLRKWFKLTVDYLPSPLDVPAIKGYLGDKEVAVPATDDHDFVALAFKVMTDPFVGSLTFFRTYAGILKKEHTFITQQKTLKNVLAV